MLNVRGQKDHIEILYKGVLMMTFSTTESTISLGWGRASYKMRHGRFKFRERAEREAFFLKDYRQTNHEIEVSLMSESSKTVKLCFLEAKGYVKAELKMHQGYTYNRLYMRMPLIDGEGIYGGGEQFAKWNLRGEQVRIWVSEHIPVSSLIFKNIRQFLRLKNTQLKAFRSYATYMVVPTFITSKKRWIHVDATDYMDFDFGDKVCDLEVRGIPKAILFGTAESYDTLMSEMTAVLGRQPKLPDWVFDGMIFGVQDGTDVCERKVAAIRGSLGAIAGLWCQDWEGQRITAFGKQLFWNWSYDQTLYHDLPARIKQWDQLGIAFLGYINPFLALEGELYQVAKQKGYLVLNADGNPYEVTITTFPAAMIDLTNPDCVKWIKGIIKTHMIGIGMKGWMADFGEYLPTDAVLFSGESAENIHNAWPAIWARVNQEAIKEAGLSGEIMFFTRAGFTQTNQYTTMMWNGDQHVDWSRDYGIGSIVNSQLSLSAVGCGASHSDIGGYTGFGLLKREKELLLRWTELGAFSPVMRSHEGNRPDDGWQFDSDEETLRIVARFSRIHQALKPYLLHLDDEKSRLGLPMIRPLFFYHDEAFAYEVDQMYLLGKDVLIAPVVEKGVTQMKVRLPKTAFVHLWTGTVYEGGEATVETPIGMPAVFYRLDSAFAPLFEMVSKL